MVVTARMGEGASADGMKDGRASCINQKPIGAAIKTGTLPMIRGINLNSTRVTVTVGGDIYLLLRVWDGKQEISITHRRVIVKIVEPKYVWGCGDHESHDKRVSR